MLGRFNWNMKFMCDIILMDVLKKKIEIRQTGNVDKFKTNIFMIIFCYVVVTKIYFDNSIPFTAAFISGPESKR